MCRWLAYSGNPIFLEELIFKRRHSLLAQSQHATEAKRSVNGDGFGLGWYHMRPEPAVFREVMPAWLDPNLKNLCYQLQSHLFFAHVRASTGTATAKFNCHPFVAGKWMFIHNGQIPEYARIRRVVENLIDDKFYSFREGTTDSEAVFLAILSRLDSGLDPIGATESVIMDVLAMMKTEKIGGPIRYTAALTDGETLYAFHYGSDGIAPTLYLSYMQGQTILASEPLDLDRDNWEPIGFNQVLVVHNHQPVHVQNLVLPVTPTIQKFPQSMPVDEV